LKTESSVIKDKKIAVLTGGESSEREISLATADSVEKALSELNIEYQVIYAENNFIYELINSGADLVFIAMHGGMGENGTLQGLLESMRLPYTGSSVLSSALCMNKIYSKKIFEYHKIKTPEWQVVQEMKEIELNMPYVIKPAMGGSTVATNIVRNENELEKAYNAAEEECLKTNDRILVEKYIPGRELTVGILDGKALPILEIEPVNDFYDYESKYESGMSKHYSPEGMDKTLYKNIQTTAELAFEVLGCYAFGRVDFRLDGSDLYSLEINTLPGMTKTSLLPEAAELAGIDFKSLVVKILESAAKKNKI
jgi:D-alanine-D-alanine ligase